MTVSCKHPTNDKCEVFVYNFQLYKRFKCDLNLITIESAQNCKLFNQQKNINLGIYKEKCHEINKILHLTTLQVPSMKIRLRMTSEKTPEACRKMFSSLLLSFNRLFCIYACASF